MVHNGSGISSLAAHHDNQTVRAKGVRLDFGNLDSSHQTSVLDDMTKVNCSTPIHTGVLICNYNFLSAKYIEMAFNVLRSCFLILIG